MNVTSLQEVSHPLLDEHQVTLYIKRDDQIDSLASGNKRRKLKYHLQQAKQEGKDKILTFGGAYSNHIYATAALGKQEGFTTIGIIRGDRISNPTLDFATQCGMQLEFISRTVYRDKYHPDYLHRWHDLYGDFYLLPEGGTNVLAVQGCAEIVSELDIDIDAMFCACSTGGTLAGLIVGYAGKSQIYGISALKGEGVLAQDIEQLVYQYSHTHYHNWRLLTDYHFGGYAKYSKELLQFMLDFEQRTGIPLEQVYTAKTLYAIFDLIQRKHFRQGDKIGMLHTGGLQGRLDEHTIRTFMA